MSLHGRGEVELGSVESVMGGRGSPARMDQMWYIDQRIQALRQRVLRMKRAHGARHDNTTVPAIPASNRRRTDIVRRR
jgi:hypothetical protein